MCTSVYRAQTNFCFVLRSLMCIALSSWVQIFCQWKFPCHWKFTILPGSQGGYSANINHKILKSNHITGKKWRTACWSSNNNETNKKRLNPRWHDQAASVLPLLLSLIFNKDWKRFPQLFTLDIVIACWPCWMLSAHVSETWQQKHWLMDPVARLVLHEYDCMGTQAELSVFIEAWDCFIHQYFRLANVFLCIDSFFFFPRNMSIKTNKHTHTHKIINNL